MNKKPQIAIVPSPHENGKTKGQFILRSSYFDAVYETGGIPVYIPYTLDKKILTAYCKDFDGFLFSGGVDLDPKYYGEAKKFESVVINEERDKFEFALFNLIYPLKKPILGICRGIQFLNVALGGSLYQHIDNHSQKESGAVCSQSVIIEKNTRLHEILGTEQTKINSFHHQAIKDLAPCLVASAYSRSPQRYIEAVEISREQYPFLMAVQWHPELFYFNDNGQKKLFECFIEACKY